jgi:hypothetical protein
MPGRRSPQIVSGGVVVVQVTLISYFLYRKIKLKKFIIRKVYILVITTVTTYTRSFDEHREKDVPRHYLYI